MQAIHWAADNCDVDALRRELERGVDPDIIEGTWTPLQFLPPEVLRKIAAFAFHAGFY